MPKKSTDSQIKRILKLWRMGWTQQRVAKACYCSGGHVSTVAAAHGLRRKPVAGGRHHDQLEPRRERLVMGYEPYRVPAAMTHAGVRHKVFCYD